MSIFWCATFSGSTPEFWDLGVKRKNVRKVGGDGGIFDDRAVCSAVNYIQTENLFEKVDAFISIGHDVEAWSNLVRPSHEEHIFDVDPNTIEKWTAFERSANQNNPNPNPYRFTSEVTYACSSSERATFHVWGHTRNHRDLVLIGTDDRIRDEHIAYLKESYNWFCKMWEEHKDINSDRFVLCIPGGGFLSLTVGLAALCACYTMEKRPLICSGNSGGTWAMSVFYSSSEKSIDAIGQKLRKVLENSPKTLGPSILDVFFRMPILTRFRWQKDILVYLMTRNMNWEHVIDEIFSECIPNRIDTIDTTLIFVLSVWDVDVLDCTGQLEQRRTMSRRLHMG
jgi:hypothetical protein